MTPSKLSDPIHGCFKHKKKDLCELTGQLRQCSRKITGPRQAILALLRKNPQPLTNKQIHAELPCGMCDLATIYRSMHLLEEMGMVQRHDFGDGVVRYELAAADGADHHHHLICTECRTVVEVDDCFPKEWENQIAQRNGFAQVTHRLEFFGLCPSCQTK